MKTLSLEGMGSFWAFQAYHKILLGVKMLPSYISESYEDFYKRIEDMPAQDQEKIIREGALFVELSKNELESLTKFCVDSNGIPYTAENMRKMTPDQIFEIIVSVCLEIAKIRVNFVTESEKKN